MSQTLRNVSGMYRRLPLAGAMIVVACGGGAEAPRTPGPMGQPEVPVPASPESRSARLPPVPLVDGPLDLSVVHPPEGAGVAVDSTFIFGSTGSGAATLTINGTPVPVARNGAFLAFLPVPRDGVYRLRAERPGERDTLVRTVRVPEPQAGIQPLVVPGSAYPGGARVALPGERIEAGFRGRRGGSARLLLPDGSSVPLVPEPGASESAHYRGFFTAQRLVSRDTTVSWPRLTGEARPRVLPMASREGPAIIEMVFGVDTARQPLPMNLLLLDPERPRVGVVEDRVPLAERGDAQVVGRPGPGWGPYDYFWPNGTELTLTGEADGQYRVRLTETLSAWSPAGEIVVLPSGTPPPSSRVGTVVLESHPGWVDVRLPVSRNLPFRVEQAEDRVTLEVFGGLARTNTVDYRSLDPLIRRVEWDQPHDELYRLTLHLNDWAWGHDVRQEDGVLLLRVRRPPQIDPGDPLRGRVIAVDAGHGGDASGARGPTGLREADAVLAVARALAAELQRAGARAVLLRDSDRDIALEDRVQRAIDAGAEVLVSVHMDAFGDGVNPYERAGSHVFYFHPRAADLARAIQVELLDEIGLPDRGIARGDLAMPRANWMPSVLTESMFMMVPQWEAALRDPAVIERLARAHARGIAEFLRERARSD